MIEKQMTDSPKDYFTERDLKKFGVSTGVVWCICTGLYQIYPPLLAIKWIPLLVSQVISFLRFSMDEKKTIRGSVFALVNGFLLFVAALGLSGALDAVKTKTVAMYQIQNRGGQYPVQSAAVGNRPSVFLYWYSKDRHLATPTKEQQ